MLNEIISITGILDHTRLKEDDAEAQIIAFARETQLDWTNVAGICIYPNWIKVVKNYISHATRIITVANFPQGHQPKHEILEHIQSFISAIDELDIVIPYRDIINNEWTSTISLLQAAKGICGSKCLKAIIEVGALQSQKLIKYATQAAIDGGADFIKTSTGHIKIELANYDIVTICEVIKSSRKHIGLKLSGGIQTIEKAKQYMDLVESIMGKDYLVPNTFRIGSSTLLRECILAKSL